MVVVALCMVLFLTSVVMAQFLLCLSEPKLKGEKTVATCSKEGSKFAFVDKSGLVHVLTQDELDLTMSFSPKIGQLPAFGMEYGGQAPKIAPLMPRLEE
jgi:hypothetical protein